MFQEFPQDDVGNLKFPLATGNRAPGLDKSFSGSEEKFGADISHLGHYSDITEKSLERSVSVICHLDSRILLLVPVVSVLL